jgi:hypothetical protein
MSQFINIFTATLIGLVFVNSSGYSQEVSKHDLLDKFIRMHNTGTGVAIEQFIKEAYHPDIYKNLEVDKHVAFYKFIIDDFDKLNPMVYKKVEETPTKLIVQLIKKDEFLANSNIDPANILVVEIDIHEHDNEYLSRGLGLGALICSIRENKGD